MNKLDYLLSGVFDNGDFSIVFPVKSVKVNSDDEAKEIGQYMDYGEIFYNVKSRTLFYNLDGNVDFITKYTENVRFEILELRESFEHETLLGLPIMEPEDYKQLSFFEWEKVLYNYCKENDLELYSFEAIGYKWEDMAKKER